ncbi:MAG: ankyrin repeat domain-containing protein [Pseudomonadota bacterium]
MISLADTILFGKPEEVTHLLNQGHNVNEIDEYGYTPLIEAAIANRIDMAELLIQHGADVRQNDLTQRSALHWASDNHNLNFCKLLLDHRADVNAYSHSGQTPLVLPLLRGQQDLKNLLLHYGADLQFTLDYINAKLIGHRFELPGHVHIVDPLGNFIVLDFEGFFFEFTASILQNSLERFKNNFAARNMQAYFKMINLIIEVLAKSGELIKYQQYNFNRRQQSARILQLLQNELVLIPVAYKGHAITYVRYGNVFVKIDRGEYGRKHGTVLFYKMNAMEKFTPELCWRLLYKRNDEYFVHEGIKEYLKLTSLYTLDLPPQISGNCSWANVEASLCVMLILLTVHHNKTNIATAQQYILPFYDKWLEWDKDRSLDECIQSFARVNPARKASKAAILANILVQRCDYQNESDLHRANRILNVLATPGYEYIIESYIKIYCQDKQNLLGNNLKHLLDLMPESSTFAIRIQHLLQQYS